MLWSCEVTFFNADLAVFAVVVLMRLAWRVW